MTNPVAPFYEFFLTLTSALPVAFSRFIGASFVVFLILIVLQLFWRTR